MGSLPSLEVERSDELRPTLNRFTPTSAFCKAFLPLGGPEVDDLMTVKELRALHQGVNVMELALAPSR